MNRQLLPICLAACLAHTASAQTEPPTAHFFSGGRRHALAPSQRWAAVQLPPQPTNARGAARFAARTPGLPPGVSASPAGRDRLLVRLGDAPELAAEQRRALRVRSDDGRALRVFEDPETGLPIVETGEVLVQFQPDVTRPRIDALAASLGAAVDKPLGRFARNGFSLKITDAATTAMDVANALHGRPEVRFAHPNFLWPIRPNFVPNDPLYAQQWNLKNTGQTGGPAGIDLGLEAAWNLTKGGGVRIAIFDDGVDIDHEEFVGKVTGGYDYYDNDNDPRPVGFDKHGTACAGVALAKGNNGVGVSGVAPDALLVPVRVYATQDAGGASLFEISRLAQAFGDVADAGVEVINCSWFTAHFDLLNTAIDYAATQGRGGKGCVLVFSSGNDNTQVRNTNPQATNATVICVAASTDLDVRAPYSNYGPEVDLTAPSSGDTLNVLTTDRTGADGYSGTNYTYFGGTSASAPMVAGIAALLLAAEPNLTAAQVRARLQSTAIKIDTANGAYDSNGHSDLYGHGRVNAFNALEKEAPVVTITSPVTDTDLTALTGISGTVTENSSLVPGVAFTLREAGIVGGSSRWWNGTAWQATTFDIMATVTGTNWSAPAGFTLPPLNSGRSFEITARAVDGGGNVSTVAGASFTSSITVLSWDGGSTAAGTVGQSQPNTNGGDYYFKVVTQNTALSAWRTALAVTSGEADIYLKRGNLPTSSDYHFKSDRVGSDGFVLHTSQFAPAEDWFILLRATPGAQWRLVTGEVFVQNLGTLAPDGSSGSGAITVGPEGMAHFRTTIPGGTLAWRLWLNGDSRNMLVRKADVPHPLSYEVQQAGQMLLVPPYLTSADYFLAVSGSPGDTVNLDSRQQAVTDLAFTSATNVTVTGYSYTTYRVQVPVQQIAWEVNVTPSSGEAHLALRRNEVPNEFVNDAYSEVAGSVTDSVTLVPETLSDGTFYITVYGAGPHTFTLTSGNPVITDINFTSQTVNDLPNKVGWRFYRIVDSAQQLGHLGWELFLTGQLPGTELAIRRNAVPGRWVARSWPYGASHMDQSSTDGYLQRPGHQADVYYLGVYQPTNALGTFTLNTRPLPAPVIAFNGVGNTTNVVGQPANRWQYFRIDVPAGVLGWHLRLKNITSGDPRLVVRRDQLPNGLGTTYPYGLHQSVWPTGIQIAPGGDWTGHPQDAAGAGQEGRRLVASLGYPLEPGTYYIGVAGSGSDSNPLSYTLESRGIGDGQTIGVTDLSFTGDGSTVTMNALPEGEAAYYRIVIPAGTPSWKVRLTPSTGDALLLVKKDFLPNLVTGGYGGSHSTPNTGVQKPGDEHLLALPESSATSLEAGTYYLAVVSEGVGPTVQRSGTGDAAFTLESLGTLSVSFAGTLGAVNDPDLVVSGSAEAGTVNAYSLTVPENTLAMEVKLEIQGGNPAVSLAQGTNVSVSGRFDYYGVVGGAGNQVEVDRYTPSGIETIVAPSPGTYTFAVKAASDYPSGIFSNANYTVRFRATQPASIAFDGGSTNITAQAAGTWRYFRVEVPAGPRGWDLRLQNVTGGRPVLQVRRDLLPPISGTAYGTNWSSGYGVAAGYDAFAGAQYNADGVDQYGRQLVLAMGNPLESGTYYVGIKNESNTDPAAYTLVSRGIGDGLSIPVTPLDFAAGTLAVNNLPVRQAAYFTLTVPASTPSWKLKLTAGTGEARLLVHTNNNSLPSFTDYGFVVQKAGDELFTLLPQSGQTSLPAGEYSLAVVSQGVNPDLYNGRLGTGGFTGTISSQGALPVVDLGTVSDVELARPDTLEGGEVRMYQFTVSAGTSAFVAAFDTQAGGPTMAFRYGDALIGPAASTTIYGDTYGYSGGETYPATRVDVGYPVTVANAAAGVYRVVVRAGYANGGHPPASYTLRLRTQGFANLDFRGSAVVENQPVNEWRFFRVDVPTGVLGWDLRLRNVTSGAPQLVIRRDLLPASGIGSTTITTTDTNWPSGGQWTVYGDWTGRLFDPGGAEDYGRIFAAGLGEPLEPGTYYVGIKALSNTGPMSYTLVSRAIGAGEAIEVTPLDFATGTATVTDLPAREAAYFRVDVPTNVPNWRLRLAPGSGEAMMVVHQGGLPNIESSRRVQKAGNEHYLLLPAAYGVRLVAGQTYYIAVVSEGVNPAAADRIGTGNSTATLQSLGALSVLDLGASSTTDLVRADTLEGGETKAYQFTIPEGAVNVELRLEDLSGNPVITLASYSNLPAPGGGYGYDGGDGAGGATLVNLVNPYPGVRTFVVNARAVDAAIPDAGYTIRIRQPAIPALNFASVLNTNGQSNAASGSLGDGERAFYRVVIPDTLDDLPVIGWKLDLSATQGYPSMRIRKDYLPDNYSSTYYPGTTIIAPPTLSPGTWYVQVAGSGTTGYQLVSEALTLVRPVWAMPAAGETPSTPGLTPPFFGDSGLGTNGVALPGDQGIDLAQGDYHYYAVDVPEGNAGLLRAQLDAISGNPDLYVRVGIIPTVNQSERALTGTGTEYANWVPMDGRFERALAPGRWYLAVYAGGNSNVRYRLRLSTGDVQDLALNGGSLASQILAAGDWRYYRVQVPLDAPLDWRVTFSQQVGDVIMHVRDTVPPGQGQSTTYYADWQGDNKNNAQYGVFDPPGTYSFTVPPLRPGHTYYLGFRAVNDASFTVSSAISGGTLGTLATIGFYNTTFNDTLPGQGSRLYRIDVPADALRWKHTSTHSTNVQFHLEQGTVFNPGYTAPWTSRSPYYPYDFTTNSSLNRVLGTNSYAWPWVPGQAYYLFVTNVAASAEAFTFVMDGRNAANEDADEDGLLDAWEILHFGYSWSYDGDSDPDEDGMSNRLEFQAGTKPNDGSSYLPVLKLLTAGGGSVTADPDLPYYAFNQSVTLTATPDAGKTFGGWSGGATGTANPLVITMSTSLVVTATFVVPRPANDDFTNRTVITGTSATINTSNIDATSETGEPNPLTGVAARKSLWWTWTAPTAGAVTISTIGSSFDTVLAVYTGDELTNLVQVASDDESGGSGTSRVTFNAAAGTTYALVVDGWLGASGNIVLNLNLSSSVAPVNDNFADRIVLTGFSLVTNANTGNATREAGEPNIGDYGGLHSLWWTWTAPASGSVTISTIGSGFDTILGVYTGNSLGTLAVVAVDDDSGGNTTSRVTFLAVAGTTYQIAVDGYSGASGSAVLNVALVAPASFSAFQRSVDGQFRFDVNGSAASSCVIEVSTNLVNWTGVLTNAPFTGTLNFTDPNAVGQPRRFYRITITQ